MVSRYLTRPCIYCGRTFTDHEALARHESAEAIEFEREANKFEGERRSRVTQSDLEDAPRQSFHQVIIEYFSYDKTHSSIVFLNRWTEQMRNLEMMMRVRWRLT